MTGITERVRQALGGTATPEAAELAITAVTNAITEGLEEDGEVRLANFGVLRIVERAPRRLKLFGSIIPSILPQRRVISFKAAPCTVLPDKRADTPATPTATTPS